MPAPTRDSFEALVRDHHAAVHRSAARWLGRDDAADVTQDVFVRVLEGKVRLAAAHDVRATLCWLGTRLAANVRRGRRRRVRHEENAMTDAATPTRSAPDPAEAAHSADLQRSVTALVDALPDDLRLPLQLHCQDRLTFQEVGSVLRVPASTAHDRVQRALQSLRTALAGRGFAVAAAGLPQLVAAVEPPAPIGLEQRLLALGDGAVAAGTGFAAKLAVGVAAVATTIAVAASAWWGTRGASEPAPPAATAAAGPAGSPVDAPATGNAGGAAGTATERRLADASPPVPPRDAGTPRAWTVATFHGTVHDAGAWPVAGAAVVAVAAGGLKPFDLGATTTDVDGRFRLELGPHTLAPGVIRLRVVEDGRLLLETDELPFARDADAAPLALVLPPEVGTALSRYDLTVTVTSADGVPLPDLPVELRADATPPPRPGHGPVEARAVTGGDGVALLRGRGLGAKWLFVDGRAAGFAAAWEPLSLARAGASFQRVVLQAGGSIEVHVTRIDGEALEWANVWLEHEGNRLTHQALLGGDGRVSFAAVGPGPHTLHVAPGHTLSPAARRGVTAGGPPIEIRLKRRDDARDVGDHRAELHGVLVDAVTGAVVDFGAFEVDVRGVRDGASTLPTDRLRPLAPFQTEADDRRYRTFHEVGLDAGRHALVAHVPGYATAVAEFELRDGEVRGDLRVPLHRGGTVRGRVVDEAGRPVRSASVFPVGTGALADRIVERWRAVGPGDGDRRANPSVLAGAGYTDADGRFTLSDLPPGVELRLVARRRDGGFAITPPRVVRAGEVTDGVELVLAPR